MTRTKAHFRYGISALVLVVSTSTAAMAQTTSQATPPGEPVTASPPDEGVAATRDIIVTGSRLRSGLGAPTPVVTTSAEQLTSSSSGMIVSALVQLPALQTSSKPTAQLQAPTRENGASFLNLRGLGKERTLVLLNGRRSVASSVSGVPDVNLFPQDLVQRVEIVTGGASAAYGSDAVAGVVNYIVDTKFSGVRANVQAGISSRGDGGQVLGSLTAGTGFGGGRGHIIASFDYYRQDGIGTNSGRPRLESGYMIGANTSGVGPARIIAPDYNFQISRSGLIVSGPLTGLQFSPNGATLVPYNFGTNRSGVNQFGGDGERLAADLLAGIERYAGFAHADYDLGDVQIYAEASAAQVTSTFENSPNFLGINPTNATIFSDNAYLSPAVSTAMATAGVTSFAMRRYFADLPRQAVNGRSRTLRVLSGLDWSIGSGWEMNAYYMHGENQYRTNISNVLDYRNVFAAIDAVVNPATGNIVCRSTLSGFDAGCVPINLFGNNSISGAAANYVLGTSYSLVKLKEDVASATLRGSPFALPAGKVNIAVGAEYRREAVSSTTDLRTRTAVSAAGLRGFPAALLSGALGGYQFNNAPPLQGSYDIKEAFAEVEVPVLRDSAIAHSLSLNGAVRYVDYSTVGGVTTWKGGISYEPFADLRLRATRSRDIRAGNVQELFTPSITRNGVVVVNGVSTSVLQTTTGNPNVRPERADTLTAGVVYRPSFLRGLAISVDYYKIKVRDTIGQLTAQQAVDQCLIDPVNGCANVSPLAGGLLNVNLPYSNVQTLRTNGVDIEVAYNAPLGSGQLGIRTLASYVGENSTQTLNLPKVDRAGDVGYTATSQIGNGVPHWSGNFSINYKLPSLTLFVQERIVGGGKIDSTLAPGALADNHIGAVFYTDLTVRVPVAGGRFELYGTVNNLFDRDPPIVPYIGVGAGRPTNPVLYDVVGRFMSFGAKVRF